MKLPRKFALFLLFIAFLFVYPYNLYAQSTRCDQCSRTIRAGSTFYKLKNKTYCSKECADRAAQATYPVCTSCRKRSPKGVTSKGKFYCSEACFEKTLPRCTSCTAPVRKGTRIGEAVLLCESCAAKPSCTNCRQPAGAEARRLEDDRLICGNCLKVAILDEPTAKAELEKVRRKLRSEFKISTDSPIEFHLCSKNKLSEIRGKSVENELGTFRYSETVSVDAFGTRKTVSKRYEIWILYGLLPERFRSVCAHELAHDWMNEFAPWINDLKHKEGWAEYVAWLYNRSARASELVKQIEKNPDPVYGNGFRELKPHLFRLRKEGAPGYLRHFSSMK